MNSQFNSFKQLVNHPIKFRLFLLLKLPAAFFVGLHVTQLTQSTASVSIRQGWFNKNPFNSIYFAALCMAAEFSTGILCMSALYKSKPSVSMLLVQNESFYYKKAVGTIVFSCTDGAAIKQAIEQSIQTGEGVTVVCNSKGFNESKELVAEMNFTWSFKVRI